jgi:hypothetical protein
MGTGGFSSGVKLPGREADYYSLTSVEVKKTWIYISTPPNVFMASGLIPKHRDNFNLLFTISLWHLLL